MKTKFFILFFALVSVFAFAQGGPNDSTVTNNCIDPSLINPNAICPAVYAPVCGCDGVTYSNSCEAEAAGVLYYYQGDCNNNGGSCIDSTLIDPNLACPMYYEPVCGCNGITYGNECDARMNGVTEFYHGACGSIMPDCFAYPYFYYSFDSSGKTVYFMNFSVGVNEDGSINNGGINVGAPNGNGSTQGLSVLWDFGDGNSSTDFNPIHTYNDSASGNYTVCLTVHDSINNCNNQYCETLYDYIYSGNCGADFDWDIVYDSINGGDSVIFYNNTPGAEDSNVVISWSYGDGSIANGINDTTNNFPGYTYGEDGDYVVCMSISDLNTGCFDIICNTVEYRKYNSIQNKKKLPQEFMVYPNPANDKFFITLNITEKSTHLAFNISDLSGKIIQSTEKKNIEKGTHIFEWSTTNISNGLYLIQVQSNNASGYKRISIMH